MSFPKKLTFIIFSFIAIKARADLPAFNNLSEAQVKTVVEEFGASAAHTTVSGASSLGEIFGIEAGVLLGAIESKGIEEVVNAVNPGTSTEVSAIPHAAIFAAASFPFGLGAELTFLPEIDNSDFNIERTGIAGKWTISDGPIDIPIVDLAIKVHHTSSKLSYVQAASGSSPASTVSFESKITGADLMVGYDLGLVVIGAEVYGSVGYVKVDGTMSSTVDIFDTTIAGLSVDSDKSGLDYKVGAAVKLLLFKVGVEYQNILGNTRYTGKLSVKF